MRRTCPPMFFKICLFDSFVLSDAHSRKSGFYHSAYMKWMSEVVRFSLSASVNQPDVTPLRTLHLKAGEGSQVLLTAQGKGDAKDDKLVDPAR